MISYYLCLIIITNRFVLFLVQLPALNIPTPNPADERAKTKQTPNDVLVFFFGGEKILIRHKRFNFKLFDDYIYILVFFISILICISFH